MINENFLCHILHCVSSNDTNSSGLWKETVTRKDKLKSTTVRFTASDLEIIACLEDKLGLGMIHVIRLAITCWAEIENVLASPPPRQKFTRNALLGIKPADVASVASRRNIFARSEDHVR